jgi:hypothetical protein
MPSGARRIGPTLGLLGPLSRLYYCLLRRVRQQRAPPGFRARSRAHRNRQWKAQGSPIQLKPTFNWLIGPSSSVLINTGARFTLCMKPFPEVSGIPLACPNNTANPVTSLCSLEDVCGFGGFGPTGVPDQSFRFVLPIFLHAGVIHIVRLPAKPSMICSYITLHSSSTWSSSSPRPPKSNARWAPHASSSSTFPPASSVRVHRRTSRVSI